MPDDGGGRRRRSSPRAEQPEPPEIRGPLVVFRQVGGKLRIGLIAKKITGIETAMDETRTIVYYSRPGSRSVNVDHVFDDVLAAVWPDEDTDA